MDLFNSTFVQTEAFFRSKPNTRADAFGMPVDVKAICKRSFSSVERIAGGGHLIHGLRANHDHLNSSNLWTACSALDGHVCLARTN